MADDNQILEFQFDRSAQEYVKSAFAATTALNSRSNQKPKNSLKNIGIWIVIFLVALIFFRLIDVTSIDAQFAKAIALGAVFAFAIAAAFAWYYSSSLRSKYIEHVRQRWNHRSRKDVAQNKHLERRCVSTKRRNALDAVPSHDRVTVRLSPDGVVSKARIVEVNAPWSDTSAVWIEDECLYIMVELFIVMIPQKALHQGMTLKKLRDQIAQFRGEDKQENL